jgi:hypothetical protein
MVLAALCVILLIGCGDGLSGSATGQNATRTEALQEELAAMARDLDDLNTYYSGLEFEVDETLSFARRLIVLSEDMVSKAGDHRTENALALDESRQSLSRIENSLFDLIESRERTIGELLGLITVDITSVLASYSNEEAEIKPASAERFEGLFKVLADQEAESSGLLDQLFDIENNLTTMDLAPSPHTEESPVSLLDWHLERGGDSNHVEVSETGSTYTFEMWLWSQPSSDAVLSIVSGDTGEVTVSPATLTFTNSNWDSAQTVTLTGVNDTDLDGDQATTITLSGVGDNWGSDETLFVVTEDDDGDDQRGSESNSEESPVFLWASSDEEYQEWITGEYYPCTSTPCGHLSVTTWNGKDIYVKVSGQSTDLYDDWYWAYIFQYSPGTWVIQYVSPALTDSAGNYLWNAHRYTDSTEPWNGTWEDITIHTFY